MLGLDDLLQYVRREAKKGLTNFFISTNSRDSELVDGRGQGTEVFSILATYIYDVIQYILATKYLYFVNSFTTNL